MGKLLKNKKILYLYTGNHPVHRKFAESIGADIRKMSWKIPKGYDIYFTEGDFKKVVILRMFRKINKNSKIINLFSDPRLFYLDKKVKFDVKKRKIKRMSFPVYHLSKKLINCLDGAICVGKFEKVLLKKFYKGYIETVDVFIEEKRYRDLPKIIPNLNNKKILFIGYGPDYYYKGLDILISVFKKLKEEIKELELFILGEKWYIKEEWKRKGIFFEGHKDIKKYLKKCSLMVHLGRGEAFGINILESFLSGVPVIVSDQTGAKETVKRVDENLIVELDEKEIAKQIKNYLDKTDIERSKISERGRGIAKEYNKKDKIIKFRNKFRELIKKINKENGNK